MSGRRESTVGSDARLLGQTSYIYEAGCAVMIDGERTLPDRRLGPADDGHPAERMLDAGIPDLLFDRFAGNGSSGTRRGTTAASSRTCFAAGSTSRRRMRCCASTATTTFDSSTTGRSGGRWRGSRTAHAYHLVPGGASKAKGVAFHLRARGYAPEDCIAVGDSVEDLETAAAVGRFFCVANGPQRDGALRAALARFPNATVTEGAMGDGFYEAVVSTLAERR